MILYAVVADSSIGALFLAGIGPGLLLAVIFAAFCVVQAGCRPRVEAPAWAGWGKAGQAVRRSIWALLMPPVGMGRIYLGIFTASEAAGGRVYALLVARLVYRSLSIRHLRMRLRHDADVDNGVHDPG